ncbi:caspase family protein [Planktothrix agardhii 1806]|uniref:caspase family protein n=1 Tax=Planktothrix agardhii TaxID=1160 RepID=UPI001F459728|nr:caspase family protein [Planktothrix agardhii]MCF3572845.1 caspase family protein [Planktothrix agardhii 1805]MCF3587496.1 caspase family protein [Planktothrix agardhii 1803]MCF3604989.1 caspase family protein [Planktothrix agardhii 1804]MCF3618339.1 caspase family protein [Planktothrix agardhii 1806]MCP9295432.1 caspase family protein [Planktothrix agardhii LY1]
MKRYICIAIGINQYQYLQPLNYAQKDAEAIYEYLVDVAGFPRDQSLLITDKSPQMSKMSTYPNRENIVDWVESFCKEQLGPEDVLWFFFSGHGFAKDGRDYLLPIDGNPTQLETTGIPIQELFDYFKAAATDKILVLLDINRAQGAHAGESVGTQTAEIARKLKIPTILSCQPEQLSRETSALRQGFFTSVLLEGLKAGQFSTLDRLIHGLEKRLPEVTEQHLRPRQNPVFAVYPASKLQQVLLPEIRQVAINLSNGIREINMATVESHQNGTAPVSEDPLKLSLSSDQGNGDRGSATGEPVEPGNLPPNSPASVIQMNSQPPASSTEDTMTESSFLQRLILWSGATALVLLLGVFLTNKPIFLGQKTAKSSVETSTVVKTPKPLPATTKPESTPPTPTPASPVQLLDESKLLLKDVSASDFSKAIAIIRQIPASDPQYKEAQGDIEHWSKTILVIAQGRALSQNLPGAVDAIKLLPDANPEIYQQGQKQLEEWEAQLKVLNNNQGILSQAKALIKPGQASSYSDAIGLVQKIPADQPGYLEAEKLIDQWGNQIWEIAQSRAKKKQYDNAIEAAKLVPENTSAYDAAQKAIADWKTNK